MERELTQREREVLDAMLGALPEGGPGIDADDLRVVGMCPCGCPTVYFTDAASTNALVTAFADGIGLVILFGWAEGPVTALELGSIADETPKEFPPAATLNFDALTVTRWWRRRPRRRAPRPAHPR